MCVIISRLLKNTFLKAKWMKASRSHVSKIKRPIFTWIFQKFRKNVEGKLKYVHSNVLHVVADFPSIVEIA